MRDAGRALRTGPAPASVDGAERVDAPQSVDVWLVVDVPAEGRFIIDGRLGAVVLVLKIMTAVVADAFLRLIFGAVAAR